jgi:hypothetical protein
MTGRRIGGHAGEESAGRLNAPGRRCQAYAPLGRSITTRAVLDKRVAFSHASDAGLDLTFLRQESREDGRNVKSAAPVVAILS